MSYDDDADMLPEQITDDFICLDEQSRDRYFQGYLAGTLSEAQRQEFEDHIRVCFKCREELDDEQHRHFNRIVRHLKAYRQYEDAAGVFFAEPLPITMISDYGQRDLLPYYKETPFPDRLAASSGASSAVQFPVTVEYAQGQLIGQFWNRAGQLVFRLKKSALGQEQGRCQLIYTSGSDPPEVHTFDIREGQDQRLGPFEDFIASDTLHDVSTALQRFQVILKKE